MAKNILVIEDDEFLRNLICRKLRLEGFTIFEAVDGEEALRKVEEEKPHLILLDLILPGINGFEVLAKIKVNPALKSIPVIVLSNLGQRDDIEKALKLGAVDFLIKAHYTPEEIIDRIKKIIEQER